MVGAADAAIRARRQADLNGQAEADQAARVRSVPIQRPRGYDDLFPDDEAAESPPASRTAPILADAAPDTSQALQDAPEPSSEQDEASDEEVR